MILNVARYTRRDKLPFCLCNFNGTLYQMRWTCRSKQRCLFPPRDCTRRPLSSIALSSGSWTLHLDENRRADRFGIKFAPISHLPNGELNPITVSVVLNRLSNCHLFFNISGSLYYSIVRSSWKFEYVFNMWRKPISLLSRDTIKCIYVCGVHKAEDTLRDLSSIY